ALHEYTEAAEVARQIVEFDPSLNVMPLVYAAQATMSREYGWALEHLSGAVPMPYWDLWHTIRLDCVARLGRWQEVLPALKAIQEPDDSVVVNAAFASMAAGRLDLAERLLEEMEDRQSGP